MELPWTCPFCQRDTTITNERVASSTGDLRIENADGLRRLRSLFIVCPNPECRKTTLIVTLLENDVDQFGNPHDGEMVQQWHLIPASRALSFPAYVPSSIVNDYQEACLIQDTSPKASATLSRRCLQGIVRDFWQVKPGRLVDEIRQLEGVIDPLTWEAIDSVRRVGNIGAHMEKDIDLIVEVDPNEAELLVRLIETLIRETYVARENRRDQLDKIKEMAARKDDERKRPTASS